MKLDRIDHRILDLLQSDNQIPNVLLAERVGMSPPACSRRVARLREAGVIARDVSILDPGKVGKSFAAIVIVTLETRRREQHEAFERKIRECDDIYQCYMVSGAVDYVLLVMLDTLEAYQAFAVEVLAEDPNVKSYESWFILSRIKSETKIDLNCSRDSGEGG